MCPVSTAFTSRSREFDISHLNVPQQQAVLHDEGPLLVLAGAGSGKTRVIIYRIARLLREGVCADRILGVTFTNKAAREMRQRLSALVGKGSRAVRLSTFHSLGLEIIKAERAHTHLRPGFSIYDTSDQLSLVRELMRQTKVADRRLDAGKVLEVILKTKKAREQEVSIDWGDDYELAAYELYKRYRAQMSAFNAVDFDDLILLAEDLLQQDPVRARWSQRFDYLLVDEFQDTSADQLSLLRVLAGPQRNLCVVGDDDQSIYAWRGASTDNILSFSRHFKGAQEVVLDQNYRSTGNILSVANAVITNNAVRKEKRLWSADGPGEAVRVVRCADAADEAEFVTDEIHKLIYQGVRPEDIAILYRSNIQSRLLEENLGLEHIPFRVVGGQAFFDRKEVRDAMAYLQLCHNPDNELALRRVINVPPRGIGVKSVEALTTLADEQGVSLWQALLQAQNTKHATKEHKLLPERALPGARQLVALIHESREAMSVSSAGHLSGVARTMFEKLRLRESILDGGDAPSLLTRRLDNLVEVGDALQRFEERFIPSPDEVAMGVPAEQAIMHGFLSNSALDSQKDENDAGGLVTLMTLHSAKGLEFPYVFMIGVEEDLLPHRKVLEEGGTLAEERRLCYVGITRAKAHLWVSHCAARIVRGKPEPRTPSRFISEFPGQAPGAARHEHEDMVLVIDRVQGDRGGADEDKSNEMANDFFRSMREKLGIDDD